VVKKHRGKSSGRKADKEFEEEVLQIDRVTRVVKGGRRLRFRATVIIGDRKGRVGVGIGKATEVASAIQKGISIAKRSLIKVPIVNDTIPHELKLKYKSVLIMMMPASQGTGIVAGGAMRKILALAGIKNVLGKTFRSSNRLVNAQATIKALLELAPVKNAERKPKTSALSDKKDVSSKNEKKEVISSKK